MITYKTIWDDYCSWFLEMIKPAYQQPIDRKTYDSVVLVLENFLKIVHPFTPFIAEEIWQQLKIEIIHILLMQNGQKKI